MTNYKKQYQILWWIFLAMLVLSIVATISIRTSFLGIAIVIAFFLGNITTRLFFNNLIELGRKYLEEKKK